MAKVYADSPTECTTEGIRFHQMVYMGKAMVDGRLQRSQEYRCTECGEFIKKQSLQEATNA